MSGLIGSASSKSGVINEISAGKISGGVNFSDLVGSIIPIGMATVPTGYLLCDGSAVSRTTYAILFAAISTTWGAGDSSTTFNVPDLEGAFLRGTGSHGTNNMVDGVDLAGPALAAFEGDQLQTHGHNIQTTQTGLLVEYAGGGGSAGYTNTGTYTTANAAGHIWRAYAPTTYTGLSGVSAGDETRPFNAGVKYCIKY